MKNTLRQPLPSHAKNLFALIIKCVISAKNKGATAPSATSVAGPEWRTHNRSSRLYKNNIAFWL